MTRAKDMADFGVAASAGAIIQTLIYTNTGDGQADNTNYAKSNNTYSTSATSSPNWSLTQPGGTFTYTSSYQGPGLRNRTTITRTSEIETTIVSSSVFSQ